MAASLFGLLSSLGSWFIQLPFETYMGVGALAIVITLCVTFFFAVRISLQGFVQGGLNSLPTLFLPLAMPVTLMLAKFFTGVPHGTNFVAEQVVEPITAHAPTFALPEPVVKG